MNKTIRAVISGAAFVGIGMALWMALLWADALRYFFAVSAAGKHHPVHPGIISDVILQTYPVMFVFAAWIVARQKWSTTAIAVYPIAYTVLVGGFVAISSRGKPYPDRWLLELITLLAPIPLSILTAALVARRRTKHMNGANNTPEGICQPADGLPKPSA